MRLPQKVLSLTPYAPVTEICRIRCDANESCFPLPSALWDTAVKRMEEQAEANRYPDPYASACCKAAAKKYGIHPEQVVAGNGSDELISLIENSFLEPGGCVATIEPDFSMYGFYADLAGLRHVRIPKGEDLRINPGAVTAALEREQADLLIFSNPCNPTSLVLPAAEVERIVRSTRALVVVDEAYMEFADESVLGLVGELENLIVLKTCSKAAGLASARVGFAAGPEELIRVLYSVKSPYNVNAFSQILAQTVLEASGYVEDCAKKLRAYTAGLYEGIRALAADFPESVGTVYPTSTNFVYFEAKEPEKIRRALLRRSIAVRAMPGHDAPMGHLRVSTARLEENEEVLAALRDALKEGV